jgi:CTP synthase (UTP-ammonia lyase)
MNRRIRIGIIGDYDPKKFFSHIPTGDSLEHAANTLAVSVNVTWVSTQSLAGQSQMSVLKQFDGLWCAPGSPYESMEGAIQAIRFAREMGWPFIAT